MSVRKRTWTTSAGEAKTSWVVDYTDAGGKRRLKTFRLKKDADSFSATSRVELASGMHVADTASITVAQAGRLWVDASEVAGLEQSTVNQYQQHVRLHINPLIGDTFLSKLTVPMVRKFSDDLRADNRSVAMVRKVLVSLGSLVADAQERGLVGRNVVRDMRGRRKSIDKAEKRQKGRLKVGIDIPTPDEIKAILSALEGHWRPVFLTAILTGMRASELRGLPWSAVDLDRNEIRVYQRADKFNRIGPPKSIAGERTIPITPTVAAELKSWKPSCPAGEHDLVFPSGTGNVESLTNMRKRGQIPLMERAGVVDTDGNAKYTGMHSLRHFYASWCINRKVDGGLALPAKMVQERLGHSTIAMTLDVYGHLFPRDDDAREMADAEAALFG